MQCGILSLEEAGLQYRAMLQSNTQSHTYVIQLFYFELSVHRKTNYLPILKKKKKKKKGWMEEAGR